MNTEGRKGELSDLKTQLRQLAGSRAVGVSHVKRELFKKVISYMTIGVDVSSLFSDMVMCSADSDVVLKKMCYLYVCNYASANPELALLTINFLLKDCQDDDPMVRGLSLRSLSGLRVKNLVEYLTSPLQKGLRDISPYVRMNAVMGVLKLYHIAPLICKENDFITTLKSLLVRDPDGQVVINSLCALEEILTSEANQKAEGAAKELETLFSKSIVYNLLNRIKDFSEWGQCVVLDLVARYVPTDPNDTFDIMNLLEDRLQHANSGVVLATIKVFLHLTLSMADIHQQVYERIKPPLLTLMSTSSSEQSFAVLSHLHLLVSRAPMLFGGDYKHFFCRFSDPTCVKKLKLEILTAIANESNTYQIVSELSEYVANVDVTIARAAIRAVGKIALESYDINGIVDRLLQFLEMDTDYITAETLVLVKDLVRKYPQWSEDCLAVVGSVSSGQVTERSAKAALVWMLGEYGHLMADSPYVLEAFVAGWGEEESPQVRAELLTAVAKLFFKRPPECQLVLGSVLSHGMADQDQDVHDRALFYYRLLQAGVDVAEKVINPPKQAVSVFADSQSSEAKDRIFDEFNSLAVIYKKPSYLFLDKDHQGIHVSASVDRIEDTPHPPQPPLSAADSDHLLPHGDSHGYSHSSAATAPTSAVTVTAAPSPAPSTGVTAASAGINDVDLLGEPVSVQPPVSKPNDTPTPLDDLLGLLTFTPSQPVIDPVPKLQLKSGRPPLVAATFQQKWGQLPVSQTLEINLTAVMMESLTGPQPLLKHMLSHNIQCMASGGTSPNFKFFFYAQEVNSLEGSGLFLVELVVNKTLEKGTAKFKTDLTPSLAEFVELFRVAFCTFGNQ